MNANNYLWILGYFIGSLPTAYIAGKLAKGIDIRQYGSGNIGATNAFRVLGPFTGTAVLAIDVLKGFASVSFLGADDLTGVLAGIAAIIGHTYPVFLKFNGGKGVATSAGVFLAVSPVPTLVAVAVFAFVTGTSRYVSLGSMSAAVVFPVALTLMKNTHLIFILGLAAAVLIIYRHRPNIKRLLDGTEKRLVWKR